MDTPVIQSLKLNDPTLLMDRCLIGGAWIGQPVDPVDNPATGEILSRVPRFGAEEATGGRRRPRRRSRPGRRSSPRSARRSCAAGST